MIKADAHQTAEASDQAWAIFRRKIMLPNADRPPSRLGQGDSAAGSPQLPPADAPEAQVNPGIWRSHTYTASMAKAPAVPWTREHLLIALKLYYDLNFGQFTATNPVIVKTAAKLGRTANSLGMKLCNFASLDPLELARGITGLHGASRNDRALWDEYRANIAVLGPESEQLFHDLFTSDQEKEVDILSGKDIRLVPPTGPTEREATVMARRGQHFFRQAVLTAYGVRCCITGINVPRLLVASHIKPWAKFPEVRVDPRNGLCLSALHDAAFDSGLITFDEDLRLVLSGRLRSHFPQPALEESFVPFEGKPLSLPQKLAEPNAAFLNYHRRNVYF